MNSTAECGRGEVERLGDTLRSPGMRRSTGVGVPPRGVRPKNLVCGSGATLEVSWLVAGGRMDCLRLLIGLVVMYVIKDVIQLYRYSYTVIQYSCHIEV